MYSVQHFVVLKTIVKELDDRCIDLRNNLLLSGSILDQQQKTIVSGTLALPLVSLKLARRAYGVK